MDKDQRSIDTMEVRILDQRLLRESYLTPYYATTGSAGMDLRACNVRGYGDKPTVLEQAQRSYDLDRPSGEEEATMIGGSVMLNSPVIIGTGVAVAVPYNHVGLLTLRSSVAKRGMILVNSPGIIDSDYRGEIMAAVRTLGGVGLRVGEMERILQLVIVPCYQVNVDIVNTFSITTTRDDKGFGSTGKY